MTIHPSGTTLTAQAPATDFSGLRATHFNPFKDTSSFTGLPSGYATLNYNEASDRNAGTLEQGALRVDGNNYMHYKSDIRFGPGGITTGKYYWEISYRDGNNSTVPYCGITGNFEQDGGEIAGGTDKAWFSHLYTSRYTQSGSTTLSDAGKYKGFQEGDTFGFAVDLDARIFYGYQHGSLFFVDTSIPDANTTKFAPFVFSTNDGSSGGVWSDTTFNFGQRPFKHTVPEGFSPIATNNITPVILRAQKHFEPLIYSGNSSGSNIITGLEFKPDFVWIKARSGSSSPGSQNNYLVDSIRGATGSVTKKLYSNSDAVENSGQNDSANGVKILDNGIELTSSNDGTNSNNNYVAWCWKAGGTAVSNTDGDVTSQVSVNDEAGFSIVSFTTPASGSGFSIGHGLSKAPEVIIMKNRDYANNWDVYHHKNGSNPEQYRLILNSTITRQDQPYLDDTVPTSTVFRTRGNGNWYNGGNNIIAYCWYAIPGYSDYGSYVGNGSSDGSFIETGFRPAFVLCKTIDGINENWTISDNKRAPINPSDAILRPDETSQETSGAGTMDFLSNGFKLRTSDTKTNRDGTTYVYMAFAERPHVSPFGSQANAR